MIETVRRLKSVLTRHARNDMFVSRYGLSEVSGSVIWLPNLVMFRTSSSQNAKSMRNMKSFAITLVELVLFVSLLSGFSSLPTGADIIALLTALGIGVCLLQGIVRGRRDYKRFRRVEKLHNNPSTEDAVEASEYIGEYRPETRYLALETILTISEGSPGKLVKHLDEDLSAFAQRVSNRLNDEDADTRKISAAVIKWFTRDYAEAFGPHAQQFTEKLNEPDSDVQADLAIALGNIGARADDPSNFAKALTPAVKDEDSDVREAAAYALKNLPCERSAKMLKYLSEDSSPEVCEQARKSFQKLTA